MSEAGNPTSAKGVVSTVVILAVAAIVIVGAWFVMNPSRLTGGATPSDEPVPMPAFSATTLDGQTISNESLRGAPTWIVFQASWCQACRSEMPDILAEAQAHPEVQVVTVYYEENEAIVADFIQRTGMDLPAIADPDRTISDAFGVRAVPHHIFVDADGMVRSSYVGAMTPSTMNESLATIA